MVITHQNWDSSKKHDDATMGYEWGLKKKKVEECTMGYHNMTPWVYPKMADLPIYGHFK